MKKGPDMHLAFLTLACILICWKFLQAQPRWLPVSPGSTQHNLDVPHNAVLGTASHFYAQPTIRPGALFPNRRTIRE